MANQDRFFVVELEDLSPQASDGTEDHVAEFLTEVPSARVKTSEI